jgi:hypothetical protein
MDDQSPRTGHYPLAPLRSGLIPPALRRDLADLNSQYLELGLAPGLEADPRFGWSGAVRRCLLATDAETRARMAAAPFALFGLVLGTAVPRAQAPRVEDGSVATVPADWRGRFESFAHQSVFLARRLVDGEPMALQLVFGLPDDAQRWLVECRLSQLAESAAGPRVVRPRWRLHERFWEMLVSAARRGTPNALQWAHCIGLCLLGAADCDATPAPSRHRPRR